MLRLSLTEEEVRKLKTLSASLGISVSELIRQWLAEKTKEVKL